MSTTVVLSAPSGGYQSTPTTYTTWTVPSGVTSIMVECWGQGGSGYAVGGNGGDYVASTITVTPGQVCQYNVGALTGPSSNAYYPDGNNGDFNGDPSWFISKTTILASGGLGAGDGIVYPEQPGPNTGSVGSIIHAGGQAGAGNNTQADSGTYNGFTGGGSAGSSGGAGLASAATSSGYTAGANAPAPSTALGSAASSTGTTAVGGSNVEAGAGSGAGNGATAAGGVPGGGSGGSDDNSFYGGFGQIRITYTTSPASMSVTEAGLATDLLTANQAALTTLPEAGTATDLPTAHQTSVTTRTEAGTATDVLNANRTTLATLPEAGTATDVLNANQTTLPTNPEAGAATDLLTAIQTALTTLPEASTAVDLVTGLLTSGSPSGSSSGSSSGSATAVPVTSIVASGTAQTVSFTSTPSSYDITLTANCTINVANAGTTAVPSLILVIRNGAGGFTWSFSPTVLYGNAVGQSSTAAGLISVVILRNFGGVVLADVLPY